MIVLRKRKRKIGILIARRREISVLRPRYSEKTPPCKDTCPSGTEIRRYITHIAQSEEYKRSYEDSFTDAFRMIAETNPFPAVCGRCCPHPCEVECNRNEKDEAVSINALEQFIGDWAIEKRLSFQRNGGYPEKIAVIGGGPSGLSCAYQLRRLGYPVTIFEEKGALGGMMRFCIPKYRLPDEVLDIEIDRILELGIDVKCNTRVGKDIEFDKIKREFSAVYVAVGAQKEIGLQIEGKDKALSGLSFLSKAKSGEKYELRKVAVIGGGNTAIDCARTALRFGADVMIVYRRGREEMPAIAEEVEAAEKEGVKFLFLTAPLAISEKKLKCIKTELTEPDETGRRRPVEIPGTEFEIDAKTVIAAIGQKPDLFGIELGEYFGGDVERLGLITDAIGAGRSAAVAIHRNLRKIEEKEAKPPLIKPEKLNLNHYEHSEKNERKELPVSERVKCFSEIRSGFSRDVAIAEAKRCLSCGMCFDCDNCFVYCSDSAVKRLEKGAHYEFDLSLCQGCEKCAQECPCGYIDML